MTAVLCYAAGLFERVVLENFDSRSAFVYEAKVRLICNPAALADMTETAESKVCPTSGDRGFLSSLF